MFRNVLLAVILLFFCWTSLAHASHLKNASGAELRRALWARLFELPEKFKQIPISRSRKPRHLPRAIEEIPFGIRHQLERSTNLSFLYWDGKAIRYDYSRENIGNDLPVYGMSMSKSITSYILGRAYCAGLIASLDDPIKKYAPALNGTFYGDVTLRNALNMSAGDKNLYANTSPGGGADWPEYMIPVVQKGVPIVNALQALGKRTPSATRYNYRNANTDVTAMVIDAVAPKGLGKFSSETLARDAGFQYPAMYLADSNRAALASAFFYATRLDWLRAGILIGEHFRSKGCIGDYLRSSITESIPLTAHSQYYDGYGKFFWIGSKALKQKNVVMAGHGGQRIFIDLEQGRVLYILNIRRDFNVRRIAATVFE